MMPSFHLFGFRIPSYGRDRAIAWLEGDFVFDKRSIAVGLFWKTYPSAIEFYFYLIPTLAFRFYYQRYQ